MQDSHPDEMIILVSKDMHVRPMGHACGLKNEGYERRRLRDVDEISTQPPVVSIENDVIDRITRDQVAATDPAIALWGVRPNRCVSRVGRGDSRQSALILVGSQSNGLHRKRLLRDEPRPWGPTPRDREYILAATLLMNPRIRPVSLVDRVGIGKNLLALAEGLEQSLDPNRRLCKLIVVMRPLVSVGNKDMGWFPGDVDGTIHPLDAVDPRQHRLSLY